MNKRRTIKKRKRQYNRISMWAFSFLELNGDVFACGMYEAKTKRRALQKAKKDFKRIRPDRYIRIYNSYLPSPLQWKISQWKKNSTEQNPR